MNLSRFGLAELLTLAFWISTVAGVKIFMKTPGKQSQLMEPTSWRFNQMKESPDFTINKRHERQTSVLPSSLNDENFSSQKKDQLRPKINHRIDRKGHDRYIRSSAKELKTWNSEWISAQPMQINYTLQDVRKKFPWLTNLLKAVGAQTLVKQSRRKRSLSGRFQPSADGLTRFNNPDYLREHLEGLKLDNYTFQPKHGIKIANGKYKVKFRQEWRKIPVYGFKVVLEQENDGNLILESADGEFLSGVEDDISSEVPAITKEDAIQRAISHNIDHGKEIENPSAKLTVYIIGGKAILAYLANYFVPGTDHALEPTSTSYTSERDPESSVGKRPWVVMDANSGQVYYQWDGLASVAKVHVERIPILVGLQSSPKTYNAMVKRDPGTNNCYYWRPIGPNTFLTVRDKPAVFYDFTTHPFPCNQSNASDYDVTNGAHSPRNTAYKWAGDAVSLLRSTSNVQINFNLDVQVHHIGNFAQWNGRAIYLGDGDESNFYPMVAPDTIMHEIAHAFTEHHSQLEAWGQPSAIEEAYSDMAGCALMNELTNETSDYIYQPGISVTKKGVPLRDMCNPRNPTVLYYNASMPIITNASEWQHSTRVHNGSAIYSKAFCQLSKKPAPWSIQSAFKVFTMANIIYWDWHESFNSGACGVRKAAKDLFNTEEAMKDVDDAFATVGVDCSKQSANDQPW